MITGAHWITHHVLAVCIVGGIGLWVLRKTAFTPGGLFGGALGAFVLFAAYCRAKGMSMTASLVIGGAFAAVPAFFGFVSLREGAGD